MTMSIKVVDQMLQKEISTMGYDLSKYLPRGFIPKMMKKTGRKKSTINQSIHRFRNEMKIVSARSKKPRPKKPDCRKTGTSTIVEKYIEDNGYDLTRRLSLGSIDKIASGVAIERKKVKNAISVIKRKNGLRVQTGNNVKRPAVNNLVEIFEPFNVEKQSPNQNKICSDRILYALMDDIPKGGAGLLIGTSTPFATSPTPKNNLLLTDELDIAVLLRMTCKHLPRIVVGNLISPKKAEIKGLFWRNINSTSNCEISVQPVDRDSYTQQITALAEEHSLVKVVLMGGGVWSCSEPSRRKYKQEFNFKSPSLYLSTVYPNLHILAMVMHGNLFKVHYIHNGNDIILD